MDADFFHFMWICAHKHNKAYIRTAKQKGLTEKGTLVSTVDKYLRRNITEISNTGIRVRMSSYI